MGLISKFVIVNGIRLHYLEGGAGRPLLIIPGWLTTAFMYRQAGEILLNNFKVFIIDVPGQGKSGKLTRNWQLADYLKTVNSFIRSQGLKNLVLVGHSLGGAISAAIYENNPGITKLILINSLGAHTPHLFKIWAKSVLKRPFNMDILIYLPEFIKTILFPHYLSLKRSLNVIFNLNLEAELKKVTKEVIILWGDKDKLLSSEYGKNLAAFFPNARFISVEEGQHSWPIIFPERFVNYLDYLCLK